MVSRCCQPWRLYSCAQVDGHSFRARDKVSKTKRAYGHVCVQHHLRDLKLQQPVHEEEKDMVDVMLDEMGEKDGYQITLDHVKGVL